MVTVLCCQPSLSPDALCGSPCAQHFWCLWIVVGAAMVGERLRLNTSLTALSLASNHIGDAGLAVLAPALRDNRTLGELSLAANDLTEGAYVPQCTVH
jgi:hypothetical protein